MPVKENGETRGRNRKGVKDNGKKRTEVKKKR